MTKSNAYKPRFYRELMGNPRWVNFRVNHLETDLWIAVSAGRYSLSVEKYSLGRIMFYRNLLDEHSRKSPAFLTSLTPLKGWNDMHPLLIDMYRASEAAGTGPMSAVAGAVAEYICNDLLKEYGFNEVVVENGGDIFLKLEHPATISVYAGESPISDKMGLIINPEQTPLSICCSSGTVGHSLSFGIADACVIACKQGALADALATACCNEIRDISMILKITRQMLRNPEIISVVIIKGDKIGIGGQLEVTVL